VFLIGVVIDGLIIYRLLTSRHGRGRTADNEGPN